MRRKLVFCLKCDRILFARERKVCDKCKKHPPKNSKFFFCLSCDRILTGHTRRLCLVCQRKEGKIDNKTTLARSDRFGFQEEVPAQ